jgi:hypothetical protein
MSTLKEIEERQNRMYKLIDQMYAEDDMTKMLQVVQLLENEARELEKVVTAFQEKADREYAKMNKKAPTIEVVLTPEQRQRVLKETGVTMTSVLIQDEVGARNAAMPNTPRAVIEAEALRQARAMKSNEAALKEAEAKIASCIEEIEAGGPLYVEAVAKMKQDPRVMAILDVRKKQTP